MRPSSATARLRRRKPEHKRLGSPPRLSSASRAAGVSLLPESLNRKPDLAEVHYLAHNAKEARYFFDRINWPALRWSFTVNRATLVPEGIDGTLDAMPVARCEEVRLADNNSAYEVHLQPGEGIIDFGALFRRLEGEGFGGHYMNAFGSLDDMLAGREYMVETARRAGVSGA